MQCRPLWCMLSLPRTRQTQSMLDADRKTALLLRHQIRGYTNNDPAAKPQKAIPLHLIRKMVTRRCSDPGLIAYHQLTIFACFFAMRSCEYLLVKGERRTHPIRLRNIVFRKKNRIVPNDSPDIELADTVTVTFEYQKNDRRDDAVTQSRTGDPSSAEYEPPQQSSNDYSP